MTQAAFTAALLDPDRAVPDGLVDPQGRPAGKRFSVYRNNVVVSLIDAMETGFPVITKLIGQQNFRNLARVFVRNHPPTTPMLMFYGAEFPAFLSAFTPLAHLPYLPDVARLELARRDAYHAADTPALSPDALGAIAPDQLMETRFALSPAMRLIDSAHPIAGIWHFNMTDGAPKPQARAESVLITRPEYDVEMTLIDRDASAFLRALADGRTLGDGYEAGLAKNQGFDLSAAIGLLLGHGLMTAIQPEGATP